MGIHKRDERFYKTHLPIAVHLDRYDRANWLLFGGLTTATPRTPATLLEQFQELMESLGMENGCKAERLHWFVRVEINKGDDQHHLHFLLGRTKVADGFRRRFTAAEAAVYVTEKWNLGVKKVTPYEKEKDGVEYVTKLQGRSTRDDLFLVSKALLKAIRPTETPAQPPVPPLDRDPFTVELITAIRERGGQAWFGDEVPHWKKKQ